MKGNIWILESWKFFACKLWNPESWALDSSIQLKEFLLVIAIQNPSSTDKESRNPVPWIQSHHWFHNSRSSWITLHEAIVPLTLDKKFK